MFFKPFPAITFRVQPWGTLPGPPGGGSPHHPSQRVGRAAAVIQKVMEKLSFLRFFIMGCRFLHWIRLEIPCIMMGVKLRFDIFL